MSTIARTAFDGCWMAPASAVSGDVATTDDVATITVAASQHSHLALRVLSSACSAGLSARPLP